MFDGDDAVKRSFFRLVSTLRATKNEEVVVRAPPLPEPPVDERVFWIRRHLVIFITIYVNKQSCICSNCVVLQEAALQAFYLPDEPQDYELHEVGGMQRLHSDDILNRNGGPDNRSSPKHAGDAWLLRAKPRDADIIKVYAGWPR